MSEHQLSLELSSERLTLSSPIQFSSLSVDNRVVLIISPDGQKRRGSDNKLLTELDERELRDLIDQLCECMRWRA